MPITSLLCLSSGSTPQYRLDILRLLALPSGSIIQFRYEQKLIPDGLRNSISNNELIGSKALLAHVDTTPTGRRADKKCQITPARHSKLVFSKRLGDICFLRFELANFAPCTDLNGFQNRVVGNVPHWVETAIRPEGDWCFESNAGEQACQSSDTIDAWQHIIKELSSRPDFASEPIFLTITGLYVRGSDTPLLANSGEFALQADKEYEAKVFHFHPETDNRVMARSEGVLSFEVSKPYLEPITTPKLAIDSPYDLKTFHFRSTQPTKKEHASLVLRVDTGTDNKPMESQPELYLPVTVGPSWVKSWGSVILLALLLAAQQYLSAGKNGSASLLTASGLFVLAAITAILVVFGLKKPF